MLWCRHMGKFYGACRFLSTSVEVLDIVASWAVRLVAAASSEILEVIRARDAGGAHLHAREHILGERFVELAYGLIDLRDAFRGRVVCNYLRQLRVFGVGEDLLKLCEGNLTRLPVELGYLG